ncbi:MAG: hypothetical protein AB1705_17105 [Verrucomicrobiota bacterium]
MSNAPFLECVVVGYTAWHSRQLAAGWWHNPFDRWGWAAFLIWLAALAWLSRGCVWPRPGSTRLMLAGVALVFLGDAGDLNVSCHAGLALVLVSFARMGLGAVLLAASAVSWMPAFGWLGSQLMVEPATLNALRIVIALGGAAGALVREQTIARKNLDATIDGSAIPSAK